LLLLPRSTGFTSKPESLIGEATAPATEGPSKKNRFVRLVLVAAAITLSTVIQSTMAIHLLTILQAQGVKMTAAVALGTLVGPSQVLARVLEMIIGRHFHPIWTMLTSTVLVSTGFALLSFHLPIVAVGIVFFGAGMGLMSIARGTVPPRGIWSSWLRRFDGSAGSPKLVSPGDFSTFGSSDSGIRRGDTNSFFSLRCCVGERDVGRNTRSSFRSNGIQE
jgi:hypothetical protein